MPAKPKTKVGRKPLPPNEVLKDGMPQSLQSWLNITSRRLKLPKQLLIRTAVGMLRRKVQAEGDKAIDVTAANGQ